MPDNEKWVCPHCGKSSPADEVGAVCPKCGEQNKDYN